MDPLEEFVMPLVDIYETGKSFVLKVDLPGVQKESINILAEPGALQIKGTIAHVSDENVKVLYSEIRRINFFRKFNIGNGINADGIVANFDDGVLTLELPKNESMRVREIPIK
jgi:HSP20 family protein